MTDRTQTVPEASMRIRASAIGILFAYRLTVAFVVAYPAARTLGAFGSMTSPTADQALFEPGGYHLLEALRLAGHAIPAATETAALVLAAAGILGLAPLALSTVTLVRPAAPLPERLKLMAEVLPRMVLLGGGTMLARALLLLVGIVAVGAASTLGERWLDERVPALLGALMALPFLLLWLLLGITQDLARAGIVRDDMSVADGLMRASETLKTRPMAALSSYAGLALSGLVLVLVASVITSAPALDVSRAGTAGLWGVLAVHQGVVLALVTLRVAWLARTLGLMGSRAGSRHGSTDADPVADAA